MRNPGLEQLDNFQTTNFLKHAISQKITNGTLGFLQNLETKDIKNGELNYTPFSYIENNDTVIVLTPFPAICIKLLKDKFPEKKIVAGLVGPGITEYHIVTHFIPANDITSTNPIIALDSKGPLNDSFYQFVKPLSRKIIDLLKAPFQTLFPKSTTIVKAQDPSIKAISQGKQSLFDGVTCGIHNIQNILALANMSSEEIQTCFSNGKLNTRTLSNADINHLYNPVNAVDVISFAAFVKSAWNNTFMKAKSVDEQNQQGFVNYFLGWPKDGVAGQKALYFLSLAFITTPVINTIKTLVQFPVNLLSESAHYLRNRLMLLSPTALPAQYLRSIGLLVTGLVENLTKGLGFVLNAVISPFENAKAAWKTNKALGVLSGLISLGAYVALAIFAAPLALSKLATVVPQFGALVSALPFNIPGLSAYSVLTMVSAAIASVFSIVKAVFNYSYKSDVKDKPAVVTLSENNAESKSTYGDLGAVLGNHNVAEIKKDNPFEIVSISSLSLDISNDEVYYDPYDSSDERIEKPYQSDYEECESDDEDPRPSFGGSKS